MRSLLGLLLLATSVFAQAGPRNAGGVDGEGGVITGIVKFQGTKPEPKPVAGFLGNAFCSAACNGVAPLDERWIFGKNGADETLQNVLVYVSKGLEGKKFEIPKQPAVIDQVNCMYTPRVVALMAGQPLEIRSSDATLHNVKANFQNNKAFNVGMSAKGEKIEKVLGNPELRADLRCVLHPWMVGWVHVLPDPFFALTGADGTFTLKGLPAGEYEISVMHETSRFEVAPEKHAVKVAAGETKKIEFVYKDPK